MSKHLGSEGILLNTSASNKLAKYLLSIVRKSVLFLSKQMNFNIFLNLVLLRHIFSQNWGTFFQFPKKDREDIPPALPTSSYKPALKI